MTDAPLTAVAAGVPDFRRLPVPEALLWLAEHGEPADPRTDIDTASLVRRFPHLAAVETTDDSVAGPNGPVPVRLYRDPLAAATGRALVWVHGGAFIGGHLDMPESNWFARELASRGIPVAAVDYTKCLGGVHYPAPSDDVLAAWRSVHESASELLGVPPTALALGGASAGGALTAGAVMRMLDAGEPLPDRLVLVYPVLHPNGPAASSELDAESAHGQLALNYAGTTEALEDPQVFAGLSDGAGFPPSLIVVCEHDELRPSGDAFAATLREAGSPATLYTEPGARHGHIDHPGDGGALRTITAIADWLCTGDGESRETESLMQTDDPTQRLRQENRAVVEAFFASNLDRPEERIALWHPDGVKELPFAPAGLPKTRWEGRDEIVANTVGNSGMFADCVHRDLQIHAGEDPELFFVTSRMVPEATFLGEPYPQSFIHVIRVRDGRVILQQEYFNSEILADAERTARAKGRSPVHDPA